MVTSMPASAHRAATWAACTSDPPASTSHRSRQARMWMRWSPAGAAMSPSLARVSGEEASTADGCVGRWANAGRGSRLGPDAGFYARRSGCRPPKSVVAVAAPDPPPAGEPCMEPRSLSIVMPVYNERATLRTALDRLLAVDLPPDTEILIVDD